MVDRPDNRPILASASPTALSGMAEICLYVRRSEKTVLDWIRSYAFPATKLGGVWESDRELVDEWRKKRIVLEREQPLRDRTR